MNKRIVTFLYWLLHYGESWVKCIEGIIGIISLGFFPRKTWYADYLAFVLEMQFKIYHKEKNGHN